MSPRSVLATDSSPGAGQASSDWLLSVLKQLYQKMWRNPQPLALQAKPTKLPVTSPLGGRKGSMVFNLQSGPGSLGQTFPGVTNVFS